MTEVENDYGNNEKQVVERQFGLEEDIDSVLQYTCPENHRFYLAQETVDIIERKLKEKEEQDEAQAAITELQGKFEFGEITEEEYVKEMVEKFGMQVPSNEQQIVEKDDLSDEQREEMEKSISRIKENIKKQLKSM